MKLLLILIFISNLANAQSFETSEENYYDEGPINYDSYNEEELGTINEDYPYNIQEEEYDDNIFNQSEKQEEGIMELEEGYVE